MSSAPLSIVSYLRLVAAAWREETRDDTTLMACFAESRDEAAFATLVGRHGPMVWQTCRRILGDTPETEDAFQATFLALACKAGRFPVESLAGWLHRVARRTALHAQASAWRRRGLERHLQAVVEQKTEEESSRVVLYAALDEELAGLPEKLRVPLVLRYLEGKTLEEVARVVGCSRPVVSKRLVRGEAILRERLERRGLAVGFLSVGALLGSTATVSAVPARLIGSTARAAVAFRSGTLTGEAVEAARAASRALPFPLESSMSAALAEGVMKTMLETKMKIGAVLLGVMLCLAGGVVLAYQALAGNAAGSPQPAGEIRGEAEASRQQGAAARVDCFGDPLPAGALARMGTVRQWYGRIDQFSPKTVLAFLPDDKTLVSQNCDYGSEDRSVCLWDAATGREIRRIANASTDTAHQSGESTLLALSPDGRTLAKVQSGAKGNEGTVYLWEVATGRLLHQLKRSQQLKREAIFCGITFLPNGKIQTLDDAKNSDNRIYLWDVAGGREISQLKGRRKGSNIYSQTLAFSRDGKMVAAIEGPDDNKIQLWEVTTGKKIHQLQPKGENARVSSVAFSPDSKTLATGGLGGICVWETTTGKPIYQFKAGGSSFFSCPLAYSPDGKTLLGGSHGHLWDVATGKEIRSFGWKNAQVAVFSPSGKLLAVGDETGAIRLWEVATGKEILPHKGHHDRVTSIAYSPDGKTLASVSDDKTVRLWDTATGKEARQLAKHTTWPSWRSSSLAYSPDGRMLASMDNVIHLWDTATGKEIRQFQGKERPQSVIFSPDGKLLAATVGHCTVCLWQVATGRQIYTLSRELTGRAGKSWSVAFSPDGRMLAVPGKDGTVSLWEVATGQPIGQLKLKQGSARVRSLAFSPDGRILATSSDPSIDGADDKTHLWEVATGKEICQLNGRKDSCGSRGLSLTFSPDGRILATISGTEHDKKIHLWEVASGKKIGQLSGHRSTVRCVAFSPDGKTLASGSDDLTCLVWDVTSFGGRLKPVPAQPLSLERLEAAWADLAQDPAKAYAAIRALQAAPAQAIPLLRERLRPVAPPDPQKLKRWISDLDDNSFTVREKAQRQIEKLGELALPALRQTLNADFRRAKMGDSFQ